MIREIARSGLILAPSLLLERRVGKRSMDRTMALKADLSMKSRAWLSLSFDLNMEDDTTPPVEDTRIEFFAPNASKVCSRFIKSTRFLSRLGDLRNSPPPIFFLKASRFTLVGFFSSPTSDQRKGQKSNDGQLLSEGQPEHPQKGKKGLRGSNGHAHQQAKEQQKEPHHGSSQSKIGDGSAGW